MVSSHELPSVFSKGSVPLWCCACTEVHVCCVCWGWPVVTSLESPGLMWIGVEVPGWDIWETPYKLSQLLLSQHLQAGVWEVQSPGVGALHSWGSWLVLVAPGPVSLLVMGQECPASQQSLSLPLASCQDEPSPMYQLPCLAFAIQPLPSRYFGKSKVPFHGL